VSALTPNLCLISFLHLNSAPKLRLQLPYHFFLMHPSIATKPQCTCSAFFESEDDLERHLDENVEQRRVSLSVTARFLANAVQFREQWIQWLQTEERRSRGHARLDSENNASSDVERSYDESQEIALTSQERQSKQHLCPSCPRTKPFTTKQSLRRHYEQRNKYLLERLTELIPPRRCDMPRSLRVLYQSLSARSRVPETCGDVH
jgi:hypothetical protein